MEQLSERRPDGLLSGGGGEPADTGRHELSISAVADADALARHPWTLGDVRAVPGGNDEPVTRLPEVIVDGNWDSTAVDASGVLLFDRHRARLQQDGRHGVLARLLLRSSSAQIKRLDLGFSDDVSVFLNNQ